MPNASDIMIFERGPLKEGGKDRARGDYISGQGGKSTALKFSGLSLSEVYTGMARLYSLFLDDNHVETVNVTMKYHYKKSFFGH